jgi:hypothetical protein
MPKIVARKVATPGSNLSPGRPKKKAMKAKHGTPRRANYRAKYGKDALEKALAAVRANKMSAREAAKHFGVPRATLGDRLAGRVKDTLGRPTELSHAEETIIVERLLLMGTWGFPYTLNDLRHLIKDYLDSAGRTTRNESNVKI